MFSCGGGAKFVCKGAQGIVLHVRVQRHVSREVAIRVVRGKGFICPSGSLPPLPQCTPDYVFALPKYMYIIVA